MKARYVREDRSGIIGKRIKDLRITLGLTPNSIAKQLKVNVSNIYKWEKGYTATEENLRRLGIILANDSKYFFSANYTKPIEMDVSFIHV